MTTYTELEEHDKLYVDRLNKHIDFPNNDESIKLFGQFRDKIYQKQLAEDNKRFRTEEFLEGSYRQVKQTIPDLDLTSHAGAILFAKFVLGTVLEITAHREASLSFMLQIYENEIKSGSKPRPRKKSKPILRRIK